VRILTMAVHDLRLALRDPGAVFWLFIAPFLWTFFFGFLNRADDPTKVNIGLTVVRVDSSAASGRLIDQLRTENFEVNVLASAAEIPTGKAAPARVLTIPGDFGDALDHRRKIELDLKEGENANPEGTFAAQLALHRAIIRLLSELSFGPQDAAQDLVRIRSSYAGRRVIPSGYSQTVPGNLVMFVLVIAMSFGAGVLTTERKKKILARLATSPLTRAELFLGKLLGRVCMAAVQVTLFVVLGTTVCRMDWGSSPLGLVLVLSGLVACASSFGLLVGVLFAVPDAAAGLGVALSLVMAGLGGCWWPSEVEPSWLQSLGHVFPTAWAMDGIHQITSWGGGVADVLLPSLVLYLFALGAGLLAVRRFSFD
jgi:ABC-type multidrug transport system permease subunit